jgi:hypothetical protein
VWFVQRTRQYCRRLRAADAEERTRGADDRPEGKTVAFQRTPVHDPLERIHNTA